MYVGPEARRSGAGRELLQHALAHATEKLAVKLAVKHVLFGVTTRNTAATGLYHSLGSQVFGTEPGFLLLDGQLHDQHHMVVRLGSAA